MSTSIPIVFDNQSGQTVYVQFLNGSFGSNQTGAGGTVPLSGDTAYDLATLSSAVPNFPDLGNIPNVSLSDFTNGRIYFNYGTQGLQGLGSGYQPSSADSNDSNYNTRYAYIELNVFGDQNNNMDLSNIDFFGFSIEASTWLKGKMVGQLTSSNGGPIIQALTPLSTGTGAFVPASTPTAPYTGFARVNGPGQVGAYHDWTDYMNYLAGLSYGTAIAGLFGGVGNSTIPAQEQQTYNLTATFDSTTGVVTLSGTTSVVGATTITINFSDLNALTGVYGANPPYTANGQSYSGIQNDVFGWIVGDLLAGMNMGFPGSTTTDPITGNPLGQCTSSEWFAAAVQQPSLQFSGAQSNASYYNGYAGALQPLTSAYGFPFSDRLGGVLLYFPPSGSPGAVDYLKITFLPD